MEPIPVAAYLVPEHASRAPVGFATVSEPMTRGLPHTIVLDRATRATVVLPSGLARAWRDADPTDVVSASADEHAPVVADALRVREDVARAPLRLVVERSNVVLAIVPVTAGLRQVVPNDGGVRGAVIEIVVLAWDLRAGTVRGAGDFGSRLSLAWRAADRASTEFAPPPMNANLARRLSQSGTGASGVRR
jgi:hypothetical protein